MELVIESPGKFWKLNRDPYIKHEQHTYKSYKLPFYLNPFQGKFRYISTLQTFTTKNLTPLASATGEPGSLLQTKLFKAKKIGDPTQITSWWLNQPIWKNMLVKLDHLPTGENNKFSKTTT